MNFFIQILSLILLSSCSLFTDKIVTQDINSEIKRVCLSSEGAGRLVIDGHKFTFKFNSAKDLESEQWFMSLIFPLYGEETFVVSWNESGLLDFQASFENKILKSKERVDPQALHIFLERWAQLITEIVLMQSNDVSKKAIPSKFKWNSSSKLLKAQSEITNHGNIVLEFKNLKSENYFGRYDVFMHSKSKESIKLELIVRKCLEKTE